MLRIKNSIKAFRPLLHVMLFFGSASAFLLLVGRERAVVLCVLLAGGNELAQYLFGYGWDFQDLADVAFDAVGVGLAILFHGRVSRWPLLRIFGSSQDSAGAKASAPQ